jgi:D-3-phosphoglycerate dehydrogenase
MIICDPTDPKAIEAMREAGIEVDVRDDITSGELETAIVDYEAMVVRSRTQVRQPLIDRAARLRLIIRAGVGLDNIDVEYAESKGVAVRNTPAASTNAVAELTVGYLFALARQIPLATASMKAGRWEKKAFSKGTELAGKTLGVVGCGRIGTLVGQKAAALGMEVLGTDPYVTAFDSCMAGTERDELLRRSDFITLHVPHTSETHHLIDEQAIAKMKDGVCIVNCGRGGILDEAALYDAIVSGKVAGAALDVFEDEKEERGQRLMALEQVIGSPHIGAGTAEAKARVGEEVARIAIEFADR